MVDYNGDPLPYFDDYDDEGGNTAGPPANAAPPVGNFTYNGLGSVSTAPTASLGAAANQVAHRYPQAASGGGTNYGSLLTSLQSQFTSLSNLANRSAGIANSGGGGASGGDPGITAAQAASLALQQQQVNNQASQFAQTFGLQSQNAAGSPFDWAQLEQNSYIQTQNLGLSASNQNLQALLGIGGLDLQQQNMAMNSVNQSNDLALRTYMAQTGANQADAQLALSAWQAQNQFGLQGYQISSNVDIAQQQLSLAQFLGNGDQEQGWAKLALASEAQDISTLVSQAQIDTTYARLQLDAQQSNMSNAIAQQKMALDAQLGAAQAAAQGASAAAAMSNAAANHAQAQAALRGVEVQLELGQGNLQLGRDQLNQALNLGLADIQQRREALGQKDRIETADLNLRAALGAAGIQVDREQIAQQRYATDTGLNIAEAQLGQQRYATDTEQTGANYRAELGTAATREGTAAQSYDNAAQRRVQEMQIFAGLRGPADAFKYQEMLSGRGPGGVPSSIAQIAGTAEGTAMQAPQGTPTPVTWGNFQQSTGLAPMSAWQSNAPINFPTAPSFSGGNGGGNAPQIQRAQMTMPTGYELPQLMAPGQSSYQNPAPLTPGQPAPQRQLTLAEANSGVGNPAMQALEQQIRAAQARGDNAQVGQLSSAYSQMALQAAGPQPQQQQQPQQFSQPQQQQLPSAAPGSVVAPGPAMPQGAAPAGAPPPTGAAPAQPMTASQASPGFVANQAPMQFQTPAATVGARPQGQGAAAVQQLYQNAHQYQPAPNPSGGNQASAWTPSAFNWTPTVGQLPQFQQYQPQFGSPTPPSTSTANPQPFGGWAPFQIAPPPTPGQSSYQNPGTAAGGAPAGTGAAPTTTPGATGSPPATTQSVGTPTDMTSAAPIPGHFAVGGVYALAGANPYEGRLYQSPGGLATGVPTTLPPGLRWETIPGGFDAYDTYRVVGTLTDDWRETRSSLTPQQQAQAYAWDMQNQNAARAAGNQQYNNAVAHTANYQAGQAGDAMAAVNQQRQAELNSQLYTMAGSRPMTSVGTSDPTAAGGAGNPRVAQQQGQGQSVTSGGGVPGGGRADQFNGLDAQGRPTTVTNNRPVTTGPTNALGQPMNYGGGTGSSAGSGGGGAGPRPGTGPSESGGAQTMGELIAANGGVWGGSAAVPASAYPQYDPYTGNLISSPNGTTTPQGSTGWGGLYGAPPPGVQGYGYDSNGQPVPNYGSGFATGTPFVPQTQLAVVHKGEAVIPANENPNNPMTTASNGSFQPIQAPSVTNLDTVTMPGAQNSLGQNPPYSEPVGPNYGYLVNQAAAPIWENVNGRWVRTDGATAANPNPMAAPFSAPVAAPQPVAAEPEAAYTPTGQEVWDWATQNVGSGTPAFQYLLFGLDPNSPTIPADTLDRINNYLETGVVPVNAAAPVAPSGYGQTGSTPATPAAPQQTPYEIMMNGYRAVTPAMNQVVGRNYFRQPTSTQEWMGALYTALGYEGSDLPWYAQQSLPQEVSYRGQYAGVGR